jgi:hypothetical protein
MASGMTLSSLFLVWFSVHILKPSHLPKTKTMGVWRIPDLSSVGGRYRCADTSPTLIVACGFTHWTRWRYRALELVASWTQWSPTARGVHLLCDWEVRAVTCCGYRCETDVASVGLCFTSATLPELWRQVHRPVAPQTAGPEPVRTKGSLIVGSKTALWEAPTPCLKSHICYKSPLPDQPITGWSRNQPLSALTSYALS